MAAIHQYPGLCNDVGFTVGTENTNAINVAVQFKHNGSDVGQRVVCLYWLSSDATGDTLASDPGTTAAGTDGFLLVEHTDDLVGLAVSEADGDLDITITHSSTSGFYLNIVPLSSGIIFTSPIVQFA